MKWILSLDTFIFFISSMLLVFSLTTKIHSLWKVVRYYIHGIPLNSATIVEFVIVCSFSHPLLIRIDMKSISHSWQSHTHDSEKKLWLVVNKTTQSVITVMSIPLLQHLKMTYNLRLWFSARYPDTRLSQHGVVNLSQKL